VRRALLLGGIAGVAAVALVVWALTAVIGVGESAGRESGVTLNQVAADPSRYEGREVVVSGEIAENRYFSLADAPTAFVIGDDARGRIIVLPQPGTELPPLDENTAVRVRGEVSATQPTAPGEEHGYLGQGGLLAGADADAFILAREIEWAVPRPGPAPPGPPPPTRTDVAQLVDEPGTCGDAPLVVAGRAWRLGDAGFVLRGDERSIFVGAPLSELERLEDGQRVRVRAELWRLSRWRAEIVRDAMASAATEGVALGDVPTARGEPFLLLRALGGEPPDETRAGTRGGGGSGVRAREGNTLQLAGLDYRVVMFRQLNTYGEPDDALYGGEPPPAGRGIYMATLVVCNYSLQRRTPTADLHLEAAFGERFEPLPAEGNPFAYRPKALQPGECAPGPGSAAMRTVDGAVVLFELPLEALQERPIVLEIAAGDERARVELDV